MRPDIEFSKGLGHFVYIPVVIILLGEGGEVKRLIRAQCIFSNRQHILTFTIGSTYFSSWASVNSGSIVSITYGSFF